MIVRRLFAAFLILACAAVPASAVFAPATFSALDTELARRRDTDFAGTLTIWDLVPGSGTLFVDTFDLPGRRVRLHFNFDAINPLAGQKTLTDATLDVAGEDVGFQSSKGFPKR